MITAAFLCAATGCSLENAERFAQPIADACSHWGIDTDRRVAHFIAQIAHESALFSRVEEDLNYTTTAACMKAWPAKFPNSEQWRPYLRSPERMANLVYANKNGNGSEASGDGYRYRGRGLIQITGLSNYAGYQHRSNIPVVSEPDLLFEPTFAADSAGYYWDTINGNSLADRVNSVTLLTRAINGWNNGINERTALTARALALFATQGAS